MSGVVDRFDLIMSSNLAEITRLSNNEKKLTEEVAELTRENQNLRARVKDALNVANATAAQFMITEKDIMNNFVSTAHAQATNCEQAVMSASCSELQRENNIYKGEIEKLRATLRLERMREKAVVHQVYE